MSNRITPQRKKAANSSFAATSVSSLTTPTLASPTRGFGIQSEPALSEKSQDKSDLQEEQTTNEPLEFLARSPLHDISRISLRPEANITANQSGNSCEQEANIAQNVMRMSAPEQQLNSDESITQSVLQRKCAACEKEELENNLQTMPLVQRQVDKNNNNGFEVNSNFENRFSQISSMRPQAKLSVSKPGDVYEQEADKVAHQVMQRMSQPLDQQPQQQKAPQKEELQTKSLANSITPLVQRQAIPDEEQQAQMKPDVQPKSGEQEKAPASNIESSIKQARGGGQPLGDDIRQPMEQAFGTDFSDVKIHTDSRSHDLNQSVQARAFTTGQDIFFRNGEYSPGSHGGKELLAHELTHVVQQNGEAVQRKTDQAVSDSSVEIAAPNDKSSLPNGKTTEGKAEAKENLPTSPEDKVNEESEKAPNHPENADKAVSPETLADEGASYKDEARENLPTSPEDKVNEESEKADSPDASYKGAKEKSDLKDKADQESEKAANPDAKDKDAKEKGDSKDKAANPDAKDKGAKEKGDSKDKAANPDAKDKDAKEKGDSKDKAANPDAKDKDAKEKGDSKDKDNEESEKADNPDAENKGEARENLPTSSGNKVDEGNEKTLNLNSEDMGKAANQETVAEKEEATTAVLEAQAQNKTINTETAQLVSKGINFAPSQKKQTDQGEDNADFLEQQRGEASNITNEFLAAGASRVQTITQLGQGIGQRIQGSVEKAKASVMESVEQQKAAVSAQIALSRDQAQTEAQATIAQIQAQHQVALVVITLTTAASRQKIESEHAISLQKVDDSENKQLTRIDELYVQAKEKYRAAGVKVGDEAVAFGEQKAKEWESQVKGKDDSLWKGPLSDNRLKARAKAAREVAKQYKDGLIEEANKQADAVDQGKAKDIEAVRDIANKSREQLQTLQKQSLENLSSLEQQALSQGTEAQTQLIQAADQTLQTTLKSLDQQELALSQLLEGYGQRQVLAIERDAQKAIASIQDGINQVATSLKDALKDTISQLQGTEAPNPEELGATLGEMLAEFDSTVVKVIEQTEQGIAASEQSITEGGQQVVGGIGKLAQSGLEESTAVTTEAKTTLTNLNQGATETFNQIQQAFTTTLTNTTQTAVTAFGQTTQGVQTAFDQVNQNLDSHFQKSVTELEDGLRGALHGSKEPNLETDIQKYADEAAAKEEPRGVKFFKTLAKVLLVVVVVVVAIVLAPTVIGAVGALAGALGAGAALAGTVGAVVGGAIVGAVAGAVIQMGNNVIDGKNLFDNIGKAMLAGAIGGALGGVGAGLGNVLGQAGKLGAGLTQSVSKFGIDVAFNVAGTIAGDLAVGNPITAEAILIGVAIGSAAYVGASNLNKLGKLGRGIQGMQTRNLQAGERLGTTLGSGIRSGFGSGKVDTPSVGRPDANMPSVKPPATETSRGGRSEVDTASGAKPDMNTPSSVKPPATETSMPGVKQPDVGVKAPETNTSNGRTPHTSEREIEPGVVAKEKAADGHEIKVLKDGRVVRCSDCGEIRQQYKDELEQNPELKQRLDDIEKMNNTDEKVKASKKLEEELSQKKIENLTNKMQELQLNDKEVTQKDIDDLTHKMQETEISHKVNNFGLDDNCYYCVGAYLKGFKSVDAMIRQTEIMQNRGGETPSKIVELYREVGLKAEFKPLQPNELPALLETKPTGALAYVREDGSGHMIVVENGKMLDPQIDNKRVSLQDLVNQKVKIIEFSHENSIGNGISTGSSGKVDTPPVDRPDVDMPDAPPATQIPQGERSEVNTSSGTKPDVDMFGTKQPDIETKAPETNTSNKRTSHTSEREIEPGVVAKETAADGHEIKVLKDGRVVRCSTCAEIRQQYKDVLEQKPDLKQRLDEIEKIKNSDDKAKASQKLEKELSRKNKIQQFLNKYKKLGNKIWQKLNQVLRGAKNADNKDTAANGAKNTFDSSPIPSSDRPNVDTSSGKTADKPGVKQPEIKETVSKTDTPSGRSTDINEAKVKELVDKLEQSPEIQQRLDEIESKINADEKGKASEQDTKAPETDASTGHSTYVDQANVEQVLNAVNSRISQSNKFELTYTKDQLESIINKGKELGLNDKVIEDLIYTGSRKDKAISADELIGQMKHWVDVVSKRGYPEKFTSLDEFQKFSRDLVQGVRGVNLPTDDIRIQGSSLRKSSANDVDIAVFMDQPTFDRLLINRYDERIVIKETKEKISLQDKSHDALIQLANDIAANPKKYNNQGGTFQNALLNGIITSHHDIIKPLKSVQREISNNYPHLNVESISVLIRGGKFDLKPDFRVKEN